MTFDPRKPPTVGELDAAFACDVVDEQGGTIPFGHLAMPEKGRVIVLFIRHFYCGLCMDFLSFLKARVSLEDLQRADVKLIVIGNGDYTMIKGYREMLELPFPVYTDADKKTYNALGMTRRTLDAGKFDKPPEYIIRGMFSNVVGSIKSAFKIGKLSSSSGDIRQIGGEFVFGPQKTVLYTHRMENTRGHAPINEIMDAAGVQFSDKT
ncbi:hypothetical protein OIO90_002163 [Microbotryomycetes sp. JL221]|nr:hypothetical protein OIO90_002163 [Microbotryomycetes sp. JL221]